MGKHDKAEAVALAARIENLRRRAQQLPDAGIFEQASLGLDIAIETLTCVAVLCEAVDGLSERIEAIEVQNGKA